MRELGWVNTCGRDWVLFFRSLLALPRIQQGGEVGRVIGRQDMRLAPASWSEQLQGHSPSWGTIKVGVFPVSSASLPFLRVCARQW